MALKLQEALSNQGYTVVMCRTSQNVDLSNASKSSNEMRQMQMHLFVYCDSK